MPQPFGDSDVVKQLDQRDGIASGRHAARRSPLHGSMRRRRGGRVQVAQVATEEEGGLGVSQAVVWSGATSRCADQRGAVAGTGAAWLGATRAGAFLPAGLSPEATARASRKARKPLALLAYCRSTIPLWKKKVERTTSSGSRNVATTRRRQRDCSRSRRARNAKRRARDSKRK